MLEFESTLFPYCCDIQAKTSGVLFYIYLSGGCRVTLVTYVTVRVLGPLIILFTLYGQLTTDTQAFFLFKHGLQPHQKSGVHFTKLNQLKIIHVL